MDVLKKLNFGSWRALYDYLADRCLINKARVRVYPPDVEELTKKTTGPSATRQPIELDIVEIKANAFDELLAQVPKQNTVDMLHELAIELYRQNRDAEPFVHFFHKLKSR